MSPRLALVTGGAGFIGSNIAAALVEAGGWDVAVCDRLRGADTGKWRNLSKHAIADFVAPEALADWLAWHEDEIEVVVHMGAVSSTTEPDADRTVQTNFTLSRDLWDWAADHGKRLIYASSAATYGDGANGFSDADDLAHLSALRPLNAYGWSKALFDLYARRSADRGRSPAQWVGLKFFNVYGPNEYHKGTMKSVVAQLFPRAAKGEPAVLFRSHRAGVPDGGQRRDFVHVDDGVDMLLFLHDRPGTSGLFNMGSGRARSFKELAEALDRALEPVGETPLADDELPPRAANL
jgi:ADP-L-glycero-D-manno-heptose 6-epimerase